MLTISVGRASLLPTIEERHDYGCRTACVANKAREAKKGQPLERPGETVHYLGCFSLGVGDALSAPHNLFLIWVEEHEVGCLREHCNIVMQRTDVEARKSEISAERTSILVHLRSHLTDPSEHICEYDRDLMDTLGEVRLALSPPRL